MRDWCAMMANPAAVQAGRYLGTGFLVSLCCAVLSVGGAIPERYVQYEHPGSQKRRTSVPALLNAFALRQDGFSIERRGETVVFSTADSLAPAASFLVTPPSMTVGTVCTLDASMSFHSQSGTSVSFRWDWEGDGTWDTEYSSDTLLTHRYITPGIHTVIMEARAPSGQTDSTLRYIGVMEEGRAGGLRYVETLTDGMNAIDGLGKAWCTTVSPDGRHVYVAGYEDHAVAVFARDTTSGTLRFLEYHSDGNDGVDGLRQAFAVTVSPDGRHVYAAGHGDNAVALFSRNTDTGSLSFGAFYQDGSDGIDGLAGAHSVVVSPDGRHVYTAGVTDHAVVVFAREKKTGRLTFVERQTDGIGGVDGLYGAHTVTVSPDGRHLYAVGAHDHAVAVFQRKADSGMLTFVEHHTDGRNGVDGLQGARSVVVSPDGRHVYTAGLNENAITTFRRDSNTGALTYLGHLTDGAEGVDGLWAVHCVSISPDGGYVYTAAHEDHAVAVFSRASSTGGLTYLECHTDAVDGVEGLSGALSVSVSPDGAHVYAAGYQDHAVTVFARESALVSPPTPPSDMNAIDCPGDSGGYVSLVFIASPNHPGASGTADDTNPLTAYYVYRSTGADSTATIIWDTLQATDVNVGPGDTVSAVVSTRGDGAAMYYWLRAVSTQLVSGLCGPNLAVPVDNSGSVRADLNGNRQVDVLDIAIIALIFGMSSEFDPVIDLNDDGAIDILDIAEIAGQFGKTV